MEACSLLISGILHCPEFTLADTHAIFLGCVCPSENAGLGLSRANGHVAGRGACAGEGLMQKRQEQSSNPIFFSTVFSTP